MRTALLALAAALALPACGSYVRIDGSADFNLLLGDEAALLFTRWVSGETNGQLYALHPLTGREMWRCALSNRVCWATPDSGMLYHEMGGTLCKRNLTNGVVLWQTPLDTLPQQKAPLPFSVTRLWQTTASKVLPNAWLPDSVRSANPKPTDFGYHDPIITGGKLLVARTAMAGGGCFVTFCFDDWFLFDLATGRSLQAGAGKYRGQLGSASLFEVPSPRGTGSVEFVVQNGERREARPWVTTGGERLDSSKLVRLGAYFLRSDDDGTLLHFEPAQGTITRLDSPAIRARTNGNWVLLPNHLLYYTTRSRYIPQSEADEEIIPRIELLDFRGQLVATLDAPAPAGTSSVWGLDYIGTIGDALALSRWQGRTNEETIEVESDDVLLLEVPACRVRRVIPLSDRPRHGDQERSNRNFQTVDGSPYLYSLTGDLTLFTMSTNSVPHEIRVDAIDAATGRIAWSHSEKVTIRKSGE